MHGIHVLADNIPNLFLVEGERGGNRRHEIALDNRVPPDFGFAKGDQTIFFEALEAGEITVKEGVVSHEASGNSASFGELALAAALVDIKQLLREGFRLH